MELRTLREPHGQALVEFALVLPVFLFAFVIYFQLLVFCHNAIVIQGSVAKVARLNALSDGAQSTSLIQDLQFVTHLLGKFHPPTLHRNSELINPWRPFKGVGGVVRTHGYLVTTEIRSGNLPFTFFFWQLPFASLKFSAEFPREPPIPEEE